MRKSLVFLGRIEAGEKLPGLLKFDKRVFEYLAESNNEIDYFFSDIFLKYTSFKNQISKLFGQKIEYTFQGHYYFCTGIFRIFFEILKRKKTIIIISGMEGVQHFILAILCKLFNKKYNYIVHGFHPPEMENINGKKLMKFKISRAERYILYNASKILLLSAHSKKYLLDNYKINTNQLYIFYHGVDNVFRNVNIRKNTEMPLKVIFTGGNLREIKGFDFLLNVLKGVKFTIEITLCGEYSDSLRCDELKKFNSQLVIKNLGNLTTNELANQYQSNDIFFLPSKFETFSIASIEAMAAGLVPIVTREIGFLEIINNDCVFTVDYFDVNSTLKILENLDKNRALLYRKKTEARESVKQFTWDKTVSDLLRIIEIENSND